MTRPYLSVIIPTYHDWIRLQRCLEALESQTLASDDFEVIVVNNDPSDPPPAGFRLPVNATLIEESAPGSYAARNAALRISRGDIVAFTDSDCVPERQWLEQGVRLLTQGCDRVGGSVRLTYGGKRLTAAEVYEKAFAFRQKINVSRGRSVTANLFAWKRVFADVGPFDASLMSGGDFEWSGRATQAGKSISYGESACVVHPARRTLRELRGKRRRVVEGKHVESGVTLSDIKESLVLPLKAVPYLISSEHLTIREKVVAFGIRYYLEMYRLVTRFRLSGEHRRSRAAERLTR